jgi:hypothetical protein
MEGGGLLKIIVENSLLKNPRLREYIIETLETGKIPNGSGMACNISNDIYVFEPIEIEEINLFGELKNGYSEYSL